MLNKLHREVRPARSWLLERIAIAVAIASLTVACIDTEFHSPELGTTYSCKAQLVCNGASFGVTPATGCAMDEADAEERFKIGMTMWLQREGARCDTIDFVDVVCTELDSICTVD